MTTKKSEMKLSHELHHLGVVFVSRQKVSRYTPGSTNIAGWKMDPNLKMYLLLKMGIFQPAMLVYQRVSEMAVFFLCVVAMCKNAAWPPESNHISGHFCRSVSPLDQ